MTQDSPSRKRGYDQLDEDLDRPTQPDYNVEDILTQASVLNNPKKLQKMMYKMTQAAAITEAPSRDSASQPCGYIKSVTLKNFMCHANFELNFGRRLNFIIGHNGSGKSAILTAITVCLGAKATDTNRGSTLKDLIKEGENQSLIRVVLSNDGNDAFQPEVYGKEIRIERRLRRDGSGSAPYILSSERGVRVSTKKADLDAILDNFNIAINNPMSFLSQDMARSFLTASTDDQKYRFFMRGTMMEEILNNLKQSKEQVERMDNKIIKMKGDVIALKTQAHEAKKLFDMLMSSNDLRERQGYLYAKYFYMEADNISGKIKGLHQTKEAYVESIQEIEDSINKANIGVESYDKNLNKIEDKIRALRIELNEAKEYQGQMQDEVSKRLGKVEVAIGELQELKRNITRKEKKITDLFNEIAKEENKLRQINGDSKELLYEQLESTKALKDQLQNEVSERRVEQGDFNASVKEKYEQFEQSISATREEIVTIKKTIQSAKSNNKDPFSGYPDVFRRVAKTIQQTRFDSTPIGPLGTYFSIKPEFGKWSRFINSAMSRDAITYVVHTYRDQVTLNKIMKGANAHASVVLRKPERFQYTQDDTYPSLLDALSFKSEEIKYILIDIKHAESIYLIEDRKEAQSYIESSNNSLIAWSLGDAGSGISTSKGMNNGLRSDPTFYDLTSSFKILPQSGQQDTSDLVDQVKLLERQLNDMQHQRAKVLQDNKLEKQKLIDHVKSLEQRLRSTQGKEYELNKKLNEDSGTGRLEGLQEELAENQQELHAYKNSIPDLDQHIEQSKESARKANDLLVQAEQTYASTYQIGRETQASKDELLSSKEFDKSKIHGLEGSKAKRVAELQSIIEKEPTLTAALQENLDRAVEYATREDADSIRGDSLQRVKQMIENINDEVEAANSKLAKSPEEIINEDNYARSKYHEAHDQFIKIKESRDLLSRSVYERLQAFTGARDYICVTADQDFKSSLQFRNFSGNLEFDFKKDKLKMLVSTKNDKKPRHVDSLSGGEKSFSQISLLLATWKPMRSRIKGLDEFDVFMDQVNRKIGMRLMLKKLSEEHDTQTIFITPQDIGQISEMDDKLVSIFRMGDPRAQR